MNALIVLSLVAASSAQIALPYNNLAYAPYAAYNGAPIAAAAGYAVPAAAAAVPAALPAALTAPSSQFQAQDELGNVNYGYQNINSAKQEVGNAYNGVTGSYSYVDAYGIPQRVDYIADALGFRVKATNLPVAPKSIAVAPVFDLEAPVFDLEAPQPVTDTEEVLAAKAEFKRAFDEALAREKRDTAEVVAAPAAVSAINALPYNAFPYNFGYAAAPFNYGYGYANAFNYGYATPYNFGYAAPAAVAHAAPVAVAAPLAAPAISAPATREAVLTKIKLNPGHAIAYRVD